MEKINVHDYRNGIREEGYYKGKPAYIWRCVIHGTNCELIQYAYKDGSGKGYDDAGDFSTKPPR